MPARIVIRDRGRGLSTTDRVIINQAFDDALRMANRVRDEIDVIWDQPGRLRKRRRRRRDAWARHTNFVRWFGSSTRHALIRRVRRRIRKIRRWLDRGRIIVPAHDASDFGCRGNRNAFVRLPGRPLHIHLCPNWFSQGRSRRAAILIHELVHELGFTHPEGVTTRAEALSLARRNSRKARRSPENYEHLYELYF